MRSRSQDKNMIDQEDKMLGMEKILGVDRLPPDIAKERFNRPDLNTMDELKSGVVWVQRDRVFSRKLNFKIQNLKPSRFFYDLYTLL